VTRGIRFGSDGFAESLNDRRQSTLRPLSLKSAVPGRRNHQFIRIPGTGQTHARRCHSRPVSAPDPPIDRPQCESDPQLRSKHLTDPDETICASRSLPAFMRRFRYGPSDPGSTSMMPDFSSTSTLPPIHVVFYRLYSRNGSRTEKNSEAIPIERRPKSQTHTLKRRPLALSPRRSPQFCRRSTKLI